MQVVILCGGRGTRLWEETQVIPKPLIKIGSKPILWHIMKIYSCYGFKDFILCLGHKGELIKEYFLNYREMTGDFTLSFRDGGSITYHHQDEVDWNITFVDTGESTATGGRVKRAAQYIQGDEFAFTYGDGVANVDLQSLLQFHKKMGATATLTGVHPMSPFGIVETQGGLAQTFKEKPRLAGLINGGFGIFKREFLNLLTGDSCVLEEEPLRFLTKKGRLAIYEHADFWYCMDTFKQVEELNKMWAVGQRPWKVWS